MTKTDFVAVTGLALIVVGFGCGFELTLLAQARAYEHAMLAGAAGMDPSQIAREIHQSMYYMLVGVPMGILGVVMLAIAFRSYILRSGKSNDATTSP